MRICPHCGGKMLPRDQRVVFVASDADLRNPLYLASLKSAVASLGLPRRQWRDAIADAVRDHEGPLLHSDGHVYEPPLVDDHFPEDEDQKWVSNFAKRAGEGKSARLQARVLERVRLIDLFFRIRFPELVAGFERFRPANDNEPDAERADEER